jgi:ribosomal protein S18 acetylase RimI-like enzyme
MGIGKNLIDGGVMFARAAGKTEIRLTVEMTNPNAIHFYEGLGFNNKSEITRDSTFIFSLDLTDDRLGCS